jgi:hypothetical protein
MVIVRLALIIVGILAILLGLLWIGQGTGYVRWPESSFMIDQSGWSVRGLMLAIAGAAMILIGRRIGR